MSSLTQREEQFALAWNSSAGDDFASQLARQSLEASARANDTLRPVLDRLLTRNQVELDLHLDGVGVRGHQTNAVAFAELIRGVADSVKEISKVALGKKSLANNLLISAPEPGSVRVVLRAAPPKPPRAKSKQTLLPEESADSVSLETVATVLAKAEEAASSPESSLDAFTSELPPRARTSVLRIAKVIKRTGWTVSGELRRPSEGAVEIKISAPGAARLVLALGETESSSQLETLIGVVDGQRKSISAMWFSPDTGRAFEAAVTSRDLMSRVAELAAEGDLRVQAVFMVTTTYPRGVSSSPKLAYVLRSIERTAKTLG